MKDILLYWSNICVLHKQEQALLKKLTAQLAQEGIALTVRFFGLGYPQRLSEYMAQPDAALPDIMVSTDLEVYEDPRLFSRFESTLYPVAKWFSLKEEAGTQAVRRGDTLLPYVSIPLVFATRSLALCAGKGVADMAGTDIAFGGINNSAVKTVVKAVWAQYGQDKAEALLESATIMDMPIQAFSRVRAGQSRVALVPTLYALRADGQTLHACYPQDGAVLIPSYICARHSMDKDTARHVVEALLHPDFTSFFVQGGDLLCHLAGSAENAWMAAQAQTYLCPPETWLSRLSPAAFYAVYTRALPQAAVL